MKKVGAVSEFLKGKKLLALLLVMILAHLGMMIFYLQDNVLNRRAVRRDAVIQKIINVIYLVEATPILNRKHAVSAINDPDLKVTFTEQPQWKMQFTKISFWKINQALRNNLGSFSISIRLGLKEWVNLKATTYAHVLFKQLLIISTEILIFMIIFMAVWSVNRFKKPLENFRKATERIGLDLHAKPVDIGGPDAIQETAKALNHMQQRIQDLIRDRTQMLAAISHDLRTPITRLKLRTQFLDDNALQENMQQDLDEMAAMINETLNFARDDAAKEEKTRLDLVSLLSTICDDAVDLGFKVEFKTPLNRLAFRGRPLALKRAFTNLINNATRYAHSAQVKLIRRQQRILITIEDDGPGIPEAELERVFAPFYRGEQSRSRDTGGTGLGLAVTRDIIQSHGGKIILKNRRPHGLRVLAEFKLLKS